MIDEALIEGTVGALGKAIDAGKLDGQALEYLVAEADGKCRKGAVRALVEQLERDLLDEDGGEDKSADPLREEELKAAKAHAEDLARQVRSLGGKISRMDEDAAKAKKVHAAEKEDLLADLELAAFDDVAWTEVGQLPTYGELVFAPQHLLHKWLQAPRGQRGYFVDANGADGAETWKAVQRYAPHAIETLNDGTVRAHCTTRTQADTVALSVGTTAKKLGREITAVVRDRADPMTHCYDKAREHGFGTERGFSVLCADSVKMSVSTDTHGQVTAVKLER